MSPSPSVLTQLASAHAPRAAPQPLLRERLTLRPRADGNGCAPPAATRRTHRLGIVAVALPRALRCGPRRRATRAEAACVVMQR